MAFNVPNYTQVPQKPVVKPTTWVRPNDWITITDTPNEVQFLVSSLGQGAYALITTFDKPASENLYIDWGDGVIDTISTNTSVTTYHNYTTGGTACSLGYDTWKIRVYVDSGASITGCQQGTPQNTLSLIYPSIASGLLEAYYGDGITIPNYNNYFLSNQSVSTVGGALANFWNLQYVKLPSVVTGSTSLTQTFSFCNSLKQVVLPVSMSGLTAFNSTFSFCNELTGTIVVPQDAINITTLANAFQNCYVLTGIILPPTLDNCNVLQNFAFNAYNLTSLILPPLPSCATFTSAFQNCVSLLYIKIPSFATAPQSLSLGSMFQGCASLQQIELPSTLTAGYEQYLATVTTAFASCSSLQNITLPTNLNFVSAANLFSNAYNLITANFPTSVPSLNSLSGTFSNCFNLQSVSLPSTTASTITMAGTFTACNSLGSMTIPSGYNITALSTTFNNCSSLKNIVLPNNAQNSCTTMANMCNNCFSLETIVMPTSLNAVTTLQNAFNNTLNLESVVFPASMNACTFMSSCFLNSGVQSITLPTSMNLCNTFANAFQNNTKIKQLTLPTTISNNANLTEMCSYCPSLETVTLATTQILSIAGTLSMFNNCPNIKTITNLDKLGTSSTVSGGFSNGTTFLTYSSSFTGVVSFVNRWSKLEINGLSSTYMSSCTGLRLSNTGASQWGGTSPQINISYTNMSTAALNLLFGDLAAQGTATGKTINITGASGAAGLTAGDRTVITSLGWTIIG
jgi:hypothetical protein